MRIHVYFALNQSQTMNCSIGIGLCFMYSVLFLLSSLSGTVESCLF